LTGASDRRLRVVTLVESMYAGGGAERLASQLAMRLDPARFESTLCFTRSPRSIDREAIAAVSAEARAAGVRLLRLDRRTTFDMRAWQRLWSVLRREHVDILHSHLFGSNVWGTLLGRLSGVPVVIAHEHTWSFQGQPLRRFLDRELVARYADAFLAVSREDRRKMIDIEHIPPSRVLFLPNGIPLTEAPSGRDVRGELGIPPDAPLVGAVGVLRRQKAFDVLLRAAAVLTLELPALKVLVVGDGPERHRLEALVRELGLEKTVVLTGFRSDVPDMLRAVDVAVSSSDFEGSPLAVMEYMDAAKPIVATRVGGIPDLIEDGVHGLLVEPRDPEGLAKAVVRLLGDRGAAAHMGERARDRRRSEFDIEVTVERLQSLYEDIIQAKQARGSRRRPLREPSKHVRPVCS
jgi:glycosyltransferase involved in cell wall biosynthesis